MAAYLSPVFGAGAQLFDNQGVVLSGGKIWTYQAGTTAPLGTWTDSTQVVANANPIILDSAGRLSNEIWLQGSSTYKFILLDSNDNVLGTWDNISGLNDITTSVTVSEWSSTSLTPTYVSTTSFSVPGNNTSVFTTNRRVKLVVSAGTVYGYVVSSAFSTVTTVVIQPDSTVLDSGVSSVEVGLLNSSSVSVPQQYMAANAPIALTAASTTNIGAALSTTVTISGTTTITAFDSVLEGIIRFIDWNAATPITYNATNMQLIGAVSRTNVAGDFSVFRSLGSGNWIEEIYQQHVSSLVPKFRVYLSANQTVTSGVLTKAHFDTRSFDVESLFDISTNYRFQPTVAGYYRVSWSIVDQTNTLNTLSLASSYLYKNGASISSGPYWGNSSLTITVWISSGSELVYMNGSTDYLEIIGIATGSGTISFGGGATGSYFCGELIP